MCRAKDKLAPFPTEVARAQVEEELGQPIEKLFSGFGEPVYSYKNPRLPKEPEKGKGVPVDEQGTYALWENFLGCVKDGNRETLRTPELGAAAFTTVAMGVQSYREGAYGDA